MRWCRSCVLPDTRPNLTIGADGVCNACRNHATKRVIDWDHRAAHFASVAANARARANGGYDCLIPVSGGKDSTWQVVTCLEHGLRPLCVTWRTPGRTAIGEANLRNLIDLGVDHIDFTIDPQTERRFMLKALERFGDPAIPMHMAIFSIPLRLAAQMRIPLIVWGENSAFEYGGTEEESRGFALDAAWLRRFGVTHGTAAADWEDGDITVRHLLPYRLPDESALAQAGTLAVFLGYYFPWDPETSLAVARTHGFRADPRGARTGLYDYADIDDDFISVHHWFKWHKFGFTRLFDNLSLEIRNGRIGRADAIAIIRARGDDTPHDDIARLCGFLDITEDRLHSIAETFRNKAVWHRQGGVWTIPDFLIPDWTWS
ncbi:N-acetyl sugar amidotransferase (plasmid) [Azospirillum brasilense]|uniref:N-acetyl sugar amidotransferase n=1 Tax=Azospirillum brasilense TaxID=192 RepID=A0A4D8RT36_AZOBR|nr:N-acetyl sugar amidotransferase [Azospirillum brasilense]